VENCATALHLGANAQNNSIVGLRNENSTSQVVADAGILALDKWTANANGRQAVFARRQRERRYSAVFIDFGYCFHAGAWRFEDAPLRGVYYRNTVYQEVRAWNAFEPWLTRMETMAEETVWTAAGEVPPEWYGGDLAEMEALVEKLLARRSRIRELIDDFRRSDRDPFPLWGTSSPSLAPDPWQRTAPPPNINLRVN
jgi:hypothetical protein